MADKAREIQLARQHGIKVAVSLSTASSVFRQAFRGILRYSRLHGPWVILTYATAAQASRVGERMGYICAIYDEQELAKIAALGMPVVNIATAPIYPGIGSVHVDNRAAGQLAAEYFLSRGFTNFLVVTHQRSAAIHRQVAFEEALAQRGLGCHRLIAGTPNVEESYTFQGLDRFLKDLPKPLAVLATEEFLGWTAIGKCLDQGIAVPEEVAVLTIGNDDIVSDACDVPMSAVTLAGERLGFEAAQLLHKMLQGEAPPAEPILIPPVEVITRQSTDVLAIEDPEIAAIVKHIREKACSGLTVMDLLQKFAIDRRKLERRFKALFNRSPYDEILRVRIERARTLLTQSDFKLPDIAEQCGFAHLQNFGRVFRLATGHTPAAFRRQFRHAQNVPRTRAV